MAASLDLTFQNTCKRFRKMNVSAAQTTLSTDIHYGNTQALVLNRVKADWGTVLKFGMVADAAANRRRQIETEKMANMLAPMLEATDYDFKNCATCEPPQIALAAYRGYKKLFGERLHAHNYPSTASTIRFMDLPGEIRNQIYRYFLVIDPPIEFAPKSYSLRSKKGNAACDHAHARLKKLKPILRLLRLSPEISKEASDIFYGENEFRFTSNEGWNYLFAFLRTVGDANVARLRCLSICVPWIGLDTDSSSGEYHNEFSHEMYNYRVKAIGLQVDLDTAPTFEKCVQLCFSILGQSGNLGVLRLVLPVSYCFIDTPIKLNLADITSNLPTTKITLVHLHKVSWEDGTTDEVDGTQQPLLVATGGNSPMSYSSPEALAKVQGWEFCRVWYDQKGRYTIL